MQQLVERTGALETLHRLLLESTTGESRVVLVTGGIASGKTRLLNTFAGRAADEGALVLTATAAKAEQGLQLGVIDQLLHSAASTLDTAALPALLGWDVTDATTTAASDTRQRIVTAVMDIARDRPLVLLIDDVQFADEASLQILLHLQLRIRTARITMVYAECAHHWSRQSWFRAELASQPHHRVQLSLLSPIGVARLAAEELGVSAAAVAAPELHALTGGNPLLVEALLDDWRTESDQHASELAAPYGAFRQAVLSRLHRSDPEVLRAAAAVAVLGDAAAPLLVAELSELESQAAAQALTVLDTAGLIDGLQFRHAAAARGVLEGLPRHQRAALHRRAAHLLHDRGAMALDVARHLVAAQGADHDWVVPTLLAAAEEAVAEDQPELGVHCLALALSAGADEPTRITVRAKLARLQRRTNPAAAALHLDALGDAARAGQLAPEEVAGVIGQLLWQGDPAAIEMSAGLADRGDARTAFAQVRLAHELIYGNARHLPSAAGDLSDESLLTAVSGDPWSRAGATLAASMRRPEPAKEAVGRSAEHLLRSWQLDDDTLGLGIAALEALIHIGQYDCAATWWEALYREAEQSRAVTWQAVLCSIGAEIARCQGDLVSAEQRATKALELLHAHSWGVMIGLPLSTLLLAQAAMGKTERPHRHNVPEAMFQTTVGLRYLHARGHHHLAAGRMLAAAGDFQQCGDLMREWNLDLPALVPWRSDLALAYVHMHQTDTALRLLAEQRALPGADRSRVRAAALRVLAAAREPQQRPGLLRQAANLYKAAGDRFETARALTELSDAWRELGEYRQARIITQQAVEEAKVHHAEGYLPRRPAEVTPLPGPQRPAPDCEQVLSDAERRVANLAAMGLTNREIARRLYITVSTVEQHLTRVYKKLAVRGRLNLSISLARHEMQAG